ncbi:unnamed protein product [Larinioides sclopetarius]|uniref:phosphoinositide phospholipase C n=1 Tax=Larinioides sclopetarius TaxID=280406 RepID=A0AAV2BT57_9ARAC
MYGLPTDTIRKEFRTRMVPSNGLNPVYNEEPFFFRKVVLPDLAVLRIAVYDENGKMLGQRILPLDGLQAGYRHVSLRTEGNFPLSLAMLFICVELKIYIPDGLGDLMDALSDPRAFLSAQEKRMAQMKAMGIEEADVQTSDLKLGSVKTGNKKDDDKKETFKMDPITQESLKSHKVFQKLHRKQQKEHNSLLKKQLKEKAAVQKSQCATIEKYLRTNKPTDVLKDPKLKETVVSQGQQWSELVEKHQREEWELLKTHTAQQGEILEKLMNLEHSKQTRQLEQKFDSDNKDMKAKQAKISVETAKEVAIDRTLRNKAEKERRLREKQSNNTKKFIDERKAAAMKQNRERDKLTKAHDKQHNELTKNTQNEVGGYANAEIEFKLADKKMYVV